MPPFDLIIVGAGSAGMMCAIAAAEAGKSVLVIEKDVLVGGSLHVTAGHLSAGGTRRQKAKGITDSWKKHYKDVLRISNNTADKDLARLATRLAPDLVDWLEDHGYPFFEPTPVIIHGHEPYSTPRTYWGSDDTRSEDVLTHKGKSVFQVIKPIWDDFVAKGLIKVHLSCKMTGLIRPKKRVLGVRATLQNGEKMEFFAPKTVLTTGGYAANSDFFKQVTEGNPRLISTARKTSMGEGITAAREIGAAFRGADLHVSTLGGIEFEPNSGRADFWKAFTRTSNAVDRLPREMYVNENGVRFINEDERSVDKRERAVLEQPNRRFWLIFDKNALENEGLSVVAFWNLDDIENAATEEKAVWQADTIENLAKKIKLDPSVLGQTVGHFNDFTDKKHDPDFGRQYLEHPILQPPFYAILTYAYSLISFGGVHVDKHLRVVDTEGVAIAGLYAAGEITGAAATSGNAFCGGMLLTPALAFGQYLGKKL